nr:hypothetical protein BDOA9_0114020 [Bradyrhizobium sp. DOA9]
MFVGQHLSAELVDGLLHLFRCELHELLRCCIRFHRARRERAFPAPLCAWLRVPNRGCGQMFLRNVFRDRAVSSAAFAAQDRHRIYTIGRSTRYSLLFSPTDSAQMRDR